MTAIEWTDATWNPTTGCDRVSPGCANCYALTLAARLKGMGQAAYQLDGDPKTSGPGFRLTLHPDRLDAPLRWRKPRMVFVNSMSDLFHEDVPFEFLDRVFGTMWQASQHTFQVLTKRPERAREYLGRVPTLTIGKGEADLFARSPGRWPLPNVWIGTSIENARFTWRADVLRETPAAVRFISAEPLLGSLYDGRRGDKAATASGETADAPAAEAHEGDSELRSLDRAGSLSVPSQSREAGLVRQAVGRAPLDLTGIDWLIAGGESGHGYRPMQIEHARELRDACLANGTAFFFKQHGGKTPKSGGKTLDGRQWCDYPVAA